MVTRILLILLLSMVDAKRHVIYWNSRMTPMLKSKSTWVLHVKIGEFMDILCPQTSLMGITHGPKEPNRFDLYNVTNSEFNNCDPGGRNNFIFACDRPEQENKLTVKFQLISPSPLGFKFQYCQDYYFLAIPRTKDNFEGCHDNITTRLHISVACKHQGPRKTKPKTTIKPTTTTVKVTSTVKATTLLTLTENKEPEIITPKLIKPKPPNPQNNFDIKTNVQSQTGNKKNSKDNSSSRCMASKTFALIIVLVGQFCTHYLTSADLLIIK